MSTPHKTIKVEPESEVGKLLAEAAESGLLVQANGTRYRVDRVETHPSVDGRRRSRDPRDDALFSIFGILDEGEPTDIARFKDQYIADAVDRRD